MQERALALPPVEQVLQVLQSALLLLLGRAQSKAYPRLAPSFLERQAGASLCQSLRRAAIPVHSTIGGPGQQLGRCQPVEAVQVPVLAPVLRQ